MNDSVEVIRPGTKVNIHPELTTGCEGTIINAAISPTLAVTYRVVWFNGTAFTSEWFMACQVKPTSHLRVDIGFVPEKK